MRVRFPDGHSSVPVRVLYMVKIGLQGGGGYNWIWGSQRCVPNMWTAEFLISLPKLMKKCHALAMALFQIVFSPRSICFFVISVVLICHAGVVMMALWWEYVIMPCHNVVIPLPLSDPNQLFVSDTCILFKFTIRIGKFWIVSLILA